MINVKQSTINDSLSNMSLLKILRVAVIPVVLSVLTSCFKEDTPVQLPAPGDAKVFGINMGEDYHRQAYFDFTTEDTLGSEHSVWDLCFESTDSGWHVWMNGGNEAFVANTDTQDFDAVTSTNGLTWKIDDPDWNIDSTAVGDWRVNRKVYVMDRGVNFSADQRYRKIIFQSVNSSEYELQFAALDGSGFVIYHIPKKPGNQFVYFTFDDNGKMLDIEPNSFAWDILFTHYRTVITAVNPPLPYLVTGVLINPSIAVSVDSTMNFSDIDYVTALTLTYSSRRDIIGYNWKRFDFTTQSYVVKPYINYILRDVEGVYWKMHFSDFYNGAGQKGYPQFEFQRL